MSIIFKGYGEQITMPLFYSFSSIMFSTITFILGFLSGAIATYLGNRYTDMWRKLEARKQTRKQFKEIKKKMPALIASMKAGH